MSETTINVNVSVKSNAKDRIQKLKEHGVNVDNLFALKGANGGEFVASIKDGMLEILQDDDPIFKCLQGQGTIPNRKLFRRWVTSQMFRMLCNPNVSYTEQLHRMGYEYQWRVLINELYAQYKMSTHNDAVNFQNRNMWFNKKVAHNMAVECNKLCDQKINGIKIRHCHGLPYKRIKGKDVFVSDIVRKILNPLHAAITPIICAGSAHELYQAVVDFHNLRCKLVGKLNNAQQNAAWVDAYKGSGAYFTLQNLIRFHGLVLKDENGKVLTLDNAEAYLDKLIKWYGEGCGWRILGILKEALKYNNINVVEKMREWRKK